MATPSSTVAWYAALQIMCLSNSPGEFIENANLKVEFMIIHMMIFPKSRWETLRQGVDTVLVQAALFLLQVQVFHYDSGSV